MFDALFALAERDFMYPLSWLAESGCGYRFPYYVLVTGPVEETAKLLCFLP